MDLSRGSCILCTNNTKIIVPPHAKNTTFLLKDLLGDQIDYEKFEKINPSLKVCPMCVHDLIMVAEHKQNIKERFSEDRDTCLLCYSEKHLVYITDWVNFDKTLENVTHEKRLAKCFACLNCVKCLDLLERMKTNLFKKYPNLKLLDFAKESKLQRTSPTTKNIHETYKKSKKSHPISSDETYDSSQSQANTINNIKAALKHLKPLKYSNFNMNRFKQDKKLLKQIAFVKLSVSNLLAKDYKLENSSERSMMSIDLSDTDSSRDSPSPKHSFFKIKLKINPTKVKSQRVTQGKVSKPKGHKLKPITEKKKELVVKILKMNFDQTSNVEYLSDPEIRTPTKASRKMLPDEYLSSSKKRKSVTFADVLDTEILGSPTRQDNADSTPLKSLLKSSISFKSGLFDNDSDESDNEKSKEPSPHFDEDLETPKSYVEEIIKNNDNIFDSLKASESTAPKPAKVIEHRHSSSIDSNSNDCQIEKKKELGSGNNKIDKIIEKEEKIDKFKDNYKKRKQIDSEDSESEEGKLGDKKETPNENKNQEIGTKSAELKKNDRKKIKVHYNSDNESGNEKEENIVIFGEVKKNKKLKQVVTYSSSDDKEDGDIVTVKEDYKVEISKSKVDGEVGVIVKATINDGEKKKDSHKKSKKSKSKKTHQKHKKRKRSSSVNDSDMDKKKAEQMDKDLSENENQKSNENDKIVRTIEEEISLSKCFQDVKKPNGSETSIDDKDVTLEEFKALRKSNSDRAGSEIGEETNNSRDEDSNSEILLLNDEEITVEKLSSRDEDLNSEILLLNDEEITVEKLSSDVESESEKNNKSNGSNDYSNLKSKSKKQSEHIVKKQEEALKISTEDDRNEEPETKRDNLSEVDLKQTDSHTNLMKKKEVPLETPELQRDAGVIDTKVDELIARYTNPSIPNFFDNVSDSQNAGASRETQGRKSESPKNVILENNFEIVDTAVFVENNSENDNTKNSDSQTTSNVSLNELNIHDNIMENVVDSC